MRDWAGPGETLDPQSFERLYRGALLLESKVRRIRAGTLVLLTGRLGLSLDEALHCHEGWIDWERATVEVPAKDPCACGACWETARDRRDHAEPITDALYEECWSPPESRTPRTIPFGWSDRLTAVLAITYDRWDVLDLSPEDALTLLEAAGRKADDVAAERARPGVLAPSAAEFFGALGLDAGRTATVLGVPRPALAPYVDGGPDAAATLARLAGDTQGETGDTATVFPVACGTEAYPAEPFDLDAVDDGALARRASQAADPDRVPREPERPESVDYDPDDHLAAGPPTRREGPGAAGGTPSSPGGAPDTPDSPGSSASLPDLADVDVPSMTDESVEAGEVTPEPSSGGGATTASSAGPPGDSAPSPDESSTGSSTDSPRDAVTQPVVADVSTRIAADGLAGGRERDGRIVLGQDELFVLRTDADGNVGDPATTPHRYVPLDTVWDVKIDHVPRRFDASFRRTVTVVHRTESRDRNAVAVQLPPSQRTDLADALYRLLLNVTRTSVTHPARVAGRVTDAESTEMVMYVRPGRIAFADADGDSLQCSFDLDDVVHVDRTERATDSRSVVEVRHVTDNRPVTTHVTMPSGRLHRLVWRYVRREYHGTLADVRGLRLSDPEKMVLVALYSTDGAPDLDAILGLDERELAGTLQSLSAKELVRTADASTELTGRGQLAVSDRLESVND